MDRSSSTNHVGAPLFQYEIVERDDALVTERAFVTLCPHEEAITGTLYGYSDGTTSNFIAQSLLASTNVAVELSLSKEMEQISFRSSADSALLRIHFFSCCPQVVSARKKAAEDIFLFTLRDTALGTTRPKNPS